MRRPAGTGVCCVIISFTLKTAVGVRLTGNFGVVSTLGVVMEAIFSSPKSWCAELFIIHRSALILLVFTFVRCAPGRPVARFLRTRRATRTRVATHENAGFCGLRRSYNADKVPPTPSPRRGSRPLSSGTGAKIQGGVL